MGQAVPVSAQGTGGLELPMDLTCAGLGDFYDTWTDGMLQLWIMRYLCEEQKARGQRKELRCEVDELQLLNAEANIARAERVAARGCRQALANLVRGAMKLRDAYYTGEVRKLIESNPARARQSMQRLQENNHSAMGILGEGPGAEILNELGGRENLPAPRILTTRQLAELSANDGQAHVNAYREHFGDWQRHSGVAGRVALYEGEMTGRLLAAHYATLPDDVRLRLRGGQDQTQNAMDTLLGSANEIDPDNPGTFGAALGKLRHGLPLDGTDFAAINDVDPDLAADLRELEAGRQEARNEFNRSMRQLGNSPFARAALNDLRGELNQATMNAYSRVEGERSPRETLEHLQYVSLLAQQVELFDQGMMTYGPRELEDGEPVEADALRSLAVNTIATARALEGQNAANPASLMGRIIAASRDPSSGFDQLREAHHRAIAEAVYTINSGDPTIREQIGQAIGVPPGDNPAENPDWNQALVRHVAAAQARQTGENVALGTRSSAQPYQHDAGALSDLLPRDGPYSRDGRYSNAAANAIFEGIGAQTAGTAIQETRRHHLQDLEGEARREQFLDMYESFHARAMAKIDEAHNRIAGSLQRGTRMDQMEAANKIASLTQAMGPALAQMMMYQQRARMVQTV